MRMSVALCIAALVVTSAGCTRIETGEVGLRINFDKTTDPTERLPGSFNQTIIGDILTFKIQDVAVAVDNMTPLASDNSTVKDFDMTVVYNVNPLSGIRTVDDQEPNLSRHERQKRRYFADAKLRGTQRAQRRIQISTRI